MEEKYPDLYIFLRIEYNQDAWDTHSSHEAIWNDVIKNYPPTHLSQILLEFGEFIKHDPSEVWEMYQQADMPARASIILDRSTTYPFLKAMYDYLVANSHKDRLEEKYPGLYKFLVMEYKGAWSKYSSHEAIWDAALRNYPPTDLSRILLELSDFIKRGPSEVWEMYRQAGMPADEAILLDRSTTYPILKAMNDYFAINIRDLPCESSS